MKKSLFLLVLACGLTANISSAATITDGQGIVYNILTEPSGDQPGTCEVGNNHSYSKQTSVAIPEFVESSENQYAVVGIATNAFYNNSALESVGLSDCTQLQSIGNSAFNGCSALESVVIPSSVTTMGSSVFRNCTSLKKLVYNAENCSGDGFRVSDYYSNYWLSGCRSLSEVVIGDKVKTIPNYAFYGCSALTSVDLSDCTQLQSIGKYAFFNCSALESVVLSDCTQLQSIGTYAFWKCSALTSVDLSASTQLRYIEYGAFLECSALTSIDLSDCTQLQSIGNSAFRSCSALRSIELPTSLTSIGYICFTLCPVLETVICHAVEVPEFQTSDFSSDNNYLFSSPMTSSGTLWVPWESVEAYRADPYWGKAKYINPINEHPVTGIELNLTGFTMAKNAAPVTVTATVTPQDVSNPELAWSLSADNIVEIVPVEDTTLSVQIKPLKAGEVTLTATAQDGSEVTAECKITVEEITGIEIGAGEGTTDGEGEGNGDDDGNGGGSGSNPGEDDGNGNNPGANTADGAYLSGNDLWLRVGQSGAITVTTTPEVDFGPQLSWQVADGSVASMTLSADGNTATFTGEAQGTTTYTVKVAGNDQLSLTGNITVIAANPVTSLRLEPESVTLALNARPFTFEAIAEPSDASVLTFTWESSDRQVVTVDDNGTLTLLAQGTAVITATAQDGTGLSATATVTVTAPIAEDFEFEFDESVMGGVEGITLEVGDTYQFVVKPVNPDAELPEITWTSSDEDVAYIDNEGEVLALAVGASTITASATVNGQEVSATCGVTVIPVKVKTLTLSAHTLLIDKPEGETLSVNFTPAEALPTITWSADDDEILEIVPGDEQTYVSLKPLKTGVTTVSVEADGQTDECEVTVTDAAGIAGIFADGDDTPVDVYDLQGRTVLSQASAAELRDLKPGFYILCKGNEVKKVLVR